MSCQGEVVAIDTGTPCCAATARASVAALGLDKMAVIAVSDAVFVAPMDRVSEVKRLVEKLKADRARPRRVARKGRAPMGLV